MLGYWSVKWDDGDSSNYYIGKKVDEAEATIRIDYCSWDSKCSDFKFTYSITQSTSMKFSYSEGWTQVRIFQKPHICSCAFPPTQKQKENIDFLPYLGLKIGSKHLRAIRV